MNYKKIILILVFAGSNITDVFCQQYTLQSSFGGDYGEEVASVISSNANDLIIIGPSGSFPSIAPIGINAQFYITKISSEGNQIWGVTEGDLNELDIPFAAIKTYDNNYLAVGYASYQGTPNQIPGDIRLLKVNEAGTIIYSKLIEYGRVTSEAKDICYTPDNNYMIAGARIDSFAWKHYPLLTKINESGDVIWTKDYKQDTIVGLYRIRQAQSGGFFALAKSTVYSSFLVKYSEDGEVMWWKDLRETGAEYDGIETIYDLEINSTGNIVVIANGHFSQAIPFECANLNPEFTYLLEMNTDGEVINRKIFCDNLELPFLYNDLTFTYDGGILLSAFPGILKLDLNWETEWYIDQIFQNEYKFKIVGQFSDSSFYGVGEIGIGNNNTDYFIVRVASDGISYVSEKINNQTVSVYPNPSYNYINVNILVNLNQPAQIKIDDINGKQVFQKSNLKDKILTIDISSFNKGIYLMMIETEQGVMNKKIVKL